MLGNRATAEATSAYARRFAELPSHFRPMLGLTGSSIGIGTYLGESDEQTDQNYEEAIQAALQGGINAIDTAVNYRFQRSERAVGRAIARLVAGGQIKREEVIVATKGGYITFDGEVPPNPRAWFDETYVKTGIIKSGELVEDSHCMAPKYLETMIEVSRANLGLETIDVYFLHNPEAQLPVVGREEFNRRVRMAFELFERKVAEGKIAAYGTATWNGFRGDPKGKDYLSLQELVGIATAVAGPEHHFKVIQLPYNLAMPEALTHSNQAVNGGQGSILDAATRMGVAVWASASILQGRLAARLPDIVGAAMEGLATDAQRAIQFVRSTPGVDVALVGMKSARHVAENLEAAKRPPASADAFAKLFSPHDEK
ncbi:MAG: aldo/keto reductase [Candidatus Binataceae bacterium]|jgi:aryl-alcohol dehydrogenase-like predicted oxidoreductase